MLSRTSSDDGTRLHRSKSAAAVHRMVPLPMEPLDPELAQHHALAAASTAYVRAYGQDMGSRDKGRASDVSRNKSNASRKSAEGSHFKESSLRSMTTTAQRSSQRPSSSRRPTTSGMNTEKFPPFYPVISTEKFPPFHSVTAVERLPTSQHSITFNENFRPCSQPRPHRPSTASSMVSQQIRKARSMYYASSVQTGSPVARPPAKFLTTPPSPPAVLHEAIKSDPPRPKTAILPPTIRQPACIPPKDTVNQARDKVFQDFQQRQVRHRPSLFLAPFQKRRDKGKNKVAPSESSGISHGARTPSDFGTETALPVFKPPKEKRSFSNSIKNKLKKVFRKTSATSTTSSLPVQQVEASRDYYGDRSTPVSASPPRHGSLEVRQPMFPRSRSHSPDIAGMRILSKPSSRSSLRSEGDISLATTSRVTSWGASSACNTITARDLKRLTVIHEAKDSNGSELNVQCPPSPKRKPPPIPGFAAFREPMPFEHLPAGVSSPVDPKRVFSALMKEIEAGKTTHVPQLSASPGSTTDDMDVFTTPALSERYQSLPAIAGLGISAHSKADSTESGARSVIRSTIRAVTPEAQTESLDRIKSVRGVVRIPRPDSTCDSEVELDLPSRSEHPGKGQGNGHDGPSATRTVTPTVEQIGQRVQMAMSRWKTPLDENHIELPRSTRRTFEVTNFATTYEHTYGGEERGDSTAPSSAEDHDNDNTIRQSIEFPISTQPRPLFSPLSPSIYSRNTDGQSILPNDSLHSLEPSEIESPGTAVVIQSQSVKSYVVGTPSPGKNRSSSDWKAWLSQEISELGVLPRENLGIAEGFGLSGHHNGHHSGHHSGQRMEHMSQVSGVSDSDAQAIDASGPDGGSEDPPSLRPEHAPPGCPATGIPTAAQVSEGAPKPSEDSHPSRKSSFPCAPSPRATSGVFSSISSGRVPSIASSNQPSIRPSLQSLASAKMNDRFPFIETGRRFSYASSKTGRTRRTTSSSETPVKGTPSPKVYSNFSPPMDKGKEAERIDARQTRGERTGELEREVGKENVTPLHLSQLSPKPLRVPQSMSELGRPKSSHFTNTNMQGGAGWNASPSRLTKYQTTSQDSQTRTSSPLGGSTTPSSSRHRLLRPVGNHPGSKLSPRPKSAIDLRQRAQILSTTPSPLTTENLARSSAQRSTTRLRKLNPLGALATASTSSITADPLRMIIGSPLTRTPSPMTPLGGRALHLKTSSSTLALNKEPSPGVEGVGIDALLEDDAILGVGVGARRPGSVMTSRKETGKGRDSATPTAGQRMAERFLRERSVASVGGKGTSAETDEGMERAFL
ncbi:hypothetical protein GQ43DRAFT_500651 [Delitschia confertaspora ATCC 74209]|uniref:Uncharacterized protein n=1 Tax=Delitschia confertaspora ATCC 74209 TaxID=1513339 RepID=A0A9P4JNV8_9PLEO|nr:hypothetical protein GQ43DRAFT_500651 [Delitschia confertaspora ATCC 74209]